LIPQSNDRDRGDRQSQNVTSSPGGSKGGERPGDDGGAVRGALGARADRFSDDAEAAMTRYIRLRRQQPNFANARSIRNALDRCRLRQANRLFKQRHEPLSRDDLCTLTAEDLLASRVFAGTGDEGAS